MKAAKLGSVSHGTLRPEDLIPAFMEALDNLKEQASLSVQPGEELEITSWVSRIDDLLGDVEERMLRNGYYEGEEPAEDINSLIDLLDQFSPPFCYFGPHQGNSSDYGWWISEDSIQDALYDKELLQVDDMGNVPADWTGMVLHVNDHGNMTLYTPGPCIHDSRVWNEVWAIV